jgi:hypothetical protein
MNKEIQDGGLEVLSTHFILFMRQKQSRCVAALEEDGHGRALGLNSGEESPGEAQ